MSNTSQNLTMMDLFAGCGGLSLGMEQAGFTPIFVNELNDDARASYLLNRSFDLKGKPFNERTELHSSDIYELTSSRLKKLKELLSLGLIEDHGLHTSLNVAAAPLPRLSKVVIEGLCSGEEGPTFQPALRKDGGGYRVSTKIFLFENVKGCCPLNGPEEKGEIWRSMDPVP